MPITRDQAKSWDILLNIFIKLLVALSVIVAFFIILHFILNASDNQAAWRLTLLDGILGSTMFIVVSHYFPAFKAASK
jgi:hypothetical protein